MLLPETLITKSLRKVMELSVSPAQEKWRIKAKKLADAEERLRQSSYRTPEDQQRNRCCSPD